MTNTYEILVSRKDDAEIALNKLAKRCAKYGDDFSFSFGEPYGVEKKRTGKRSRFIKYVSVTVDGMAPSVGDYTFIGKIVTEGDAVLVDMVPFETRPEGEIDSETCEHCNVNRRRKTVYLVRENKTEIVKQVGRTCLRDHMGIDTPEHTLTKFTYIKEVDDLLSDEYGLGGSGTLVENVHEVLTVTSAAIKRFGWLPKWKASEENIPTAYIVLEAFDTKTKNDMAKAVQREVEANREEHSTHADDVMSWVLANEQDGDYMYNLQQLVQAGTMALYKRTPLMASAVASYDSHMNRLKERELLSETSKHVGEEKLRMKGQTLTFVTERLYTNAYGVVHFMQFADKDGNVIVWKTSAPIEKPEEPIVCDFTVKNHTEYNGVKQTNVLRLKVKD